MKKEHILVIRFSAMGDVAMVVPVVYSLAQQYPDVRITVLSRTFARPLFEDLAPNVNFMAADLKKEYHGIKGLNALYRRLAAKQFTAVADLHNVLRSEYLRLRFNIGHYRVEHINKHRKGRRRITAKHAKRLEQQPTSFENYVEVFKKLGYPVEIHFKSIFPEGEKGNLNMLPKGINVKNSFEQWIGIDERQHQYSYRHGLELIPDVPLDTDNNSIIFLNEKVYEWSFSAFKKNNHWGYNFSLDAHVYGTKFIYRLLNHASFSNPNTLESCVGLHVGKKNLLTIGRCGEYICILSYPINVVQKVFKNAALNASPRTLNDYYLKGYILEYPPINNITAFQVYPEHVYVTKNAERITLFLERNDHP